MFPTNDNSWTVWYSMMVGFAALRFHINTKKSFWNINIEAGTISTYADSIDRNWEIVREFGLVYTIYFK